jgi:hypothetical protein
VQRAREAFLPAIDKALTLGVFVCQAVVPLLSKYDRFRWISTLTGITTIRENSACLGVINQAQVWADCIHTDILADIIHANIFDRLKRPLATHHLICNNARNESGSRNHNGVRIFCHAHP